MTRFPTKLSAPLMFAFAVGACAGGADSSSSSSNGGSAASNSNGTNVGGSNSSGTNVGGSDSSGTNVGGGLFSTSTSPSGTGGLEACAGDTQVAKLVPLDLVVMFDGSGSMVEKTGTGQTKWDATRNAMKGFLSAPTSAGLGVGLEFFPALKAGVPEVCTAAGQCGSGGPCLLGSCLFETQITGQLSPCEKLGSNAECKAVPGDTCDALGQCSKNPSYVCSLKYQPSCGKTEDGQDLGSCVPMQAQCVNGFSCEAADYASLAVAISTLPGAAGSLSSALDNHEPGGQTPTGPALQGAISQAQSWVAQNPKHKTVVVLATDGLPTSCDPQDPSAIGAFAKAAFQANPSVPTFVIGTFSPAEQNVAKKNLDIIANAGGTGQAFILDASADVTAQFTAALDKIRGESLACEYLIPEPPAGETLDYGKVNVKYSPDGGAPETIGYLKSAAECGSVDGGWYYDVDPSAGNPTKILVCPATCDRFKNGGSVDIQLGCETQIAVPK